MYPMKLIPTCKDYIWGGTRLKEDFEKKTDLDKVAESWELSCHKDGPGVIANGRFEGMTLPDYLEQTGRSVLGSNAERFENFPILIKLIDARDNLSVQVHPNNDYALRVEGEYGKTEMWYIVDCEPGASLLYGFDRPIDKTEFAKRIQDNTLLEVTNRVPVKKGDVFFIEAGTLHAIGAGILIAEIQQNSNTTYRIYDYGRVGNDGKPRELHLEKALDVTSLCPPSRNPGPMGPLRLEQGAEKTRLATCDYFTTDAVTIEEEANFTCDETSFQALLFLSGNATIRWTEDGAMETLSVKKGDTVFVPAGVGAYTVTGKTELLFTTV